MENRIAAGSYFQNSPSGVYASFQRSSSNSDRERYLACLLAEREALGQFMPILPICNMLLNQEITRVWGLMSTQYLGHEMMGHKHPYGSFGQQPIEPMNVGKKALGAEENKLIQKLAPSQPSPLHWHSAPGAAATSPIVKRVIRLEVPVDKFPNYDFVDRIMGPRGNYLRRLEAQTECRIHIRGQGSVKDPRKAEELKDKSGYEHLNEPLHILLEAEFPEDLIDSQVKLAVTILEEVLTPVVWIGKPSSLKITISEETTISPSMSPSMSPFSSTKKKQSKRRR